MSFILNIETATKNCSVSIAKNGETIVCKEIAEEGYSHAEKLHVFIEEVIAEAGLNVQDLNAVAVSQGPGSYTGLRIGVSAAKGLCFALNIPLIAIDTLQTLASQAKVSEGKIIPMLDARRMEVYSEVFNAKLETERAIEAEVITQDSFAEYNETVYFVGDCAGKCKPVLTKENFVFLEEIKFPSASAMSKISYDKYQKSDIVDVAYFEPYYLKDFMMAPPSKKQ
ncbi:tRNA threonylcarbamoyladenosine biosynthesis protein TsaB [Flavobacterium sp. Leaf82]|uniref:tRNA (adenosine(37)-N6)-threonylcarbamoyltransferase complex dimerization subunit type 1 TsaB n=1 Tax=unclassified Flavobacterium TaxID=196869 RepID=UPI0006F82B79|nr:tRNA (adenosine(37)-N6)-threonylcarbamoyltransferase complex dimerization subunit type 1 TsaB [Flavobacterium sp. Leaf82]KQO34760.1 tRNA threonylcarbamoyladenosine biosynthesis protein TsaB [Flavobacterium sp. Leaf82]